MACTITLKDYLQGGPVTSGGDWYYSPSTPINTGDPVNANNATLSIDSGAAGAVSPGTQIGTGDGTTVGVSATMAGDYNFHYMVGTSPCDAIAYVTVTVLDGAVAGVASTTTICTNDTNAFNLFSSLGGTAMAGGTWSGGPVTSNPGNGTTYGYIPGNAGDATDDAFIASVGALSVAAGQYVFNYTVSALPGSSCDDCEDMQTVTINVTSSANAGSNGTVTVCNTP